MFFSLNSLLFDCQRAKLSNLYLYINPFVLMSRTSLSFFDDEEEKKITSKFKHLVIWRIQGLGAVSGASGLHWTVGRTDRDGGGTDGLYARQKHRVHGIHVSSARAEDCVVYYMLKLHILLYIGALSGYRPINGIFRSLIRLLLTFRIIAHANLV